MLPKFVVTSNTEYLVTAQYKLLTRCVTDDS